MNGRVWRVFAFCEPLPGGHGAGRGRGLREGAGRSRLGPGRRAGRARARVGARSGGDLGPAREGVIKVPVQRARQERKGSPGRNQLGYRAVRPRRSALLLLLLLVGRERGRGCGERGRRLMRRLRRRE